MESKLLETEDKILIEIIKDKYCVFYSYKRNPKDFELLEKSEITKRDSGEKESVWKHVGWYGSMDSVFVAILKTPSLNKDDTYKNFMTVDDYVQKIIDLYHEIKRKEESILSKIKEV